MSTLADGGWRKAEGPQRLRNAHIYAHTSKGERVEVLDYRNEWLPVYGSHGRDDETLYVSWRGRVVPSLGVTTYRIA